MIPASRKPGASRQQGCVVLAHVLCGVAGDNIQVLLEDGVEPAQAILHTQLAGRLRGLGADDALRVRLPCRGHTWTGVVWERSAL